MYILLISKNVLMLKLDFSNKNPSNKRPTLKLKGLINPWGVLLKKYGIVFSIVGSSP